VKLKIKKNSRKMLKIVEQSVRCYHTSKRNYWRINVLFGKVRIKTEKMKVTDNWYDMMIIVWLFWWSCHSFLLWFKFAF